MKEIEERILVYLNEVGEASNKDISDYLQKDFRTVSKSLQSLLSKGLIEISRQEGRKKYYKLKESQRETQTYILKPKSIDQLRQQICRLIDKHNWASYFYHLPIIALLISKYTNLKLIIFGSQASGKTCCIKAVFNPEEPFIIQDLHRKNLYDYVNLIKENIKIIEQQYRHNWAKEDCKIFDKFEIVPCSKIAPSEFLFRYLPLRIKQPSNPKTNFSQFKVDLDIKIKEPPQALKNEFIEKLRRIKYFTIDVSACRMALEQIKEAEISNLYFVDRDGNPDPQVSAKQWKIERQYQVILSNDFLTVNHKKLRNLEYLWLCPADDLQLSLQALEIFKFCYSIDKENAQVEALKLFAQIMKTFTLVRVEDLNPKKEKNSVEPKFPCLFIPENKMWLGVRP